MGCEARQYSDQMLCKCGLAWDLYDLDPPTCRRIRHVPDTSAADRKIALSATREQKRVKLLEMPVELSTRVAAEAFDVFSSHRKIYGDADAMKAAYRFILRAVA